MNPELRRTLVLLAVGLIVVVGAIVLLLRVGDEDRRDIGRGDPLAGTPEQRLAAVRERLLELSLAQDTFHRRYGVYGRSVGQMRFEVPRGMTIEIIGSTTDGWAAQASVEGVARLCTIFEGDSATWVVPPAVQRGQPACAAGAGGAR